MKSNKNSIRFYSTHACWFIAFTSMHTIKCYASLRSCKNVKENQVYGGTCRVSWLENGNREKIAMIFLDIENISINKLLEVVLILLPGCLHAQMNTPNEKEIRKWKFRWNYDKYMCWLAGTFKLWAHTSPCVSFQSLPMNRYDVLAHILLLLFIICYIFGNFYINIRLHNFCWSNCWSSWCASSASDRTRQH